MTAVGRGRDDEVARLDVSVRDVLRVQQLERHQPGHEEIVHEPARPRLLALLSAHVRLEIFAVDVLHHDVVYLPTRTAHTAGERRS
jgi:hypothetical protein